MSLTIDTERFGGIARLYGTDSLPRLAAAHVAIVGVGGVGSWAAEALIRSGVGSLTLIDPDDVCITNTNRQLPALATTIGLPKVSALRERLLAIHPSARIFSILEYLVPNNAERLLDAPFDFVIDAVDRMSIKALIIHTSVARGLRVLTTGGAAGRRDLTQIRLNDLAATGGDLLLRQVRKKLRQSHGWAKGNGQFYGVPAVFSAEPQVFPWSDGSVRCQREEDTNLTLDCASGFGSACFVTGTFGFAAAGEVVRQLVATPTDVPDTNR